MPDWRNLLGSRPPPVWDYDEEARRYTRRCAPEHPVLGSDFTQPEIDALEAVQAAYAGEDEVFSAHTVALLRLWRWERERNGAGVQEACWTPEYDPSYF